MSRADSRQHSPPAFHPSTPTPPARRLMMDRVGTPRGITSSTTFPVKSKQQRNRRTQSKTKQHYVDNWIPVSRARSSPMPGVVASGEWPITARTTPHVTNHRGACRLQTFRRSRSSRLGSRKEECGQCFISDMFLYLIMLNLLKENYVLHAIQLWMIICVVTVCYCEMFEPSSIQTQFVDKWSPRVIFRTRIMRRLGCKLFITSHLCYMSLMSQSVDHTSKNRVLCYKNSNINVVINNST